MEIDPALDHHIDGESQPRSVDALIAQLAGAQHGVVARRQLGALGVGRGAIDRRVQRGRLHVVHRGVYAVGHRALTQHGHWMAAVLAAGLGAMLSHHSAAALWGIRPTSRARIDVTVPRTLHATKHLHPHCAVLPQDEVATHQGIPVTTAARTLLDLAATLDLRQLERAFNEAEVQNLGAETSVADLLDRYPHHRGTTNLRTLLLNARSSTRSELEAEFLAFLDHHRLPRPETNTIIEGMEVDAAWREHHLIVELDGYAHHGTRAAFEADRRRDRKLIAAGWTVLRVTWRDLTELRHELAAQIRALLSMPPFNPAHPPNHPKSRAPSS
jgi:very-short-patch-repair endonuclease